jgi:hypothetical protein
MDGDASILTIYKFFTNQGKSMHLIAENLCCIVSKDDAEIVTKNFINESEQGQFVPVYPPDMIEEDENEYFSSIRLIDQSDLIRYFFDSYHGKTNLQAQFLEPFMHNVRLFNFSDCQVLCRDHST